MIERSPEWWADRIGGEPDVPITAGRPDAMVSTGSIATAIGGPGPRLADEFHRNRVARAFMAKAAATNSTSSTIGEIIRSYRLAEYEAATNGSEISPAYLAFLKRMVDEAMETADLTAMAAGMGMPRARDTGERGA